MKQVNLTIDGRQITVDENLTVLDAARKLNIKIPTLCHLNLEELNVEHTNASCRICVVEIDGRRNLAPSCATPVTEGMVVKTHSRVIKSAKVLSFWFLTILECFQCFKSTDCDLQTR